LNFEDHTIHISKSWDYDNNKIFDYDSDEINKETKNRSSTRVIKVDQHLLDILTQLRPNNHERLFIDPDGKIPTSSAVNKVLRKQLKKLNINKKNFHFHSLRHTHVAMLLFKGVNLYSISKRLGHSNMSITANTYAYMLDELKQKSDKQIVNILDEI
ncbi:site-specific integrase, partial [Lactobacillus crispatus]